MSLSPTPSHARKRKRKVDHVVDHCGEAQPLGPTRSQNKRRCRSGHSHNPLIPTEQDIPTLVTSASVSSPQTPESPIRLPDSATEPIVTSYKNASTYLLPSECLPPRDEIPTLCQLGPSAPEESESPPRTPIDWVYDAYDEDFGRKVCDAYEFSWFREQIRACNYGETTAQEWKRGSTPAVARESFNAAVKGVKAPPETPSEFVYQDRVDDEFGGKVCEAYTSSRWRVAFRERKYGESIAHEWKRGSTPEEAREAYKVHAGEVDREMRALSPTPEGEDPAWRQEWEQKLRDQSYGKEPRVLTPPTPCPCCGFQPCVLEYGSKTRRGR
ncbi:MAG: hypothetical protein Q9207_004483 [Kuettlingeria erythrocarpa]